MLKNLLTTDSLSLINSFLSTLVALCIGVLSIIISRNANRSAVARERLEKVYHPLFLSLEPFLYKPAITKEEITPFLNLYKDLEEKYSILISPELRWQMQLLSADDFPIIHKKDVSDPFFSVCKDVSHEYDKLCRLAHLPTRSLDYRNHHNQFSSRLAKFFFLLGTFSPALIVLFFVLALQFPVLVKPAFYGLLLLILTVVIENF